MKITRLSVVLSLLQMLRKEKDPPLTAYSILLTLAASEDAEGRRLPLTSHQISLLMGDDTTQNSSIHRLVDKDLLVRSGPDHKGGVYMLTPAGDAEVARILAGKLKPRPAPSPNMVKVIARAAGR